jgi:tetratricopeptide (TPR) repeat protein
MDAGVSHYDPATSNTRLENEGIPFGTLARDRNPARSGVDLTECELRALLNGFDAARIRLGFRKTLDNPDVGIIVLHRLAEVGGTAISLKSLAAPPEAREAYDKAREELVQQEPSYSAATTELEKAVELYPEFAAAWQLLGELRLQLQDQGGAREAFEKSRATDPEYIKPYLSLARLSLGERRWEESARLSSQVIELNPDVFRAHYMHGLACFYLGKIDAAEKSFRTVQNGPEAQNYPATHYTLGVMLAQRGEVSAAAAEFRVLLEIAPNASVAGEVRQQLAIWIEQGQIEPQTVPAAPEK